MSDLSELYKKDTRFYAYAITAFDKNRDGALTDHEFSELRRIWAFNTAPQETVDALPQQDREHLAALRQAREHDECGAVFRHTLYMSM